MTELTNPNRQPILRKYMNDVLAWHGYVRFVGMPTLQTNPDIPMDDLYVPQSLSESYLKPENKPDDSLLSNPARMLAEQRRMVVLGDPGCGKSTLINYFAWFLSSGFTKKLPGELNYIVPIPMVLRDLTLSGVESFADLIQAFMTRPVAKKLAGELALLEQYLEAGRAIFLIDGLDEVGVETRKKLKNIILQGFALYPKCFFLCTSRIVGYDEAPLTNKPHLKQILALAEGIDDCDKVAESTAEYKVDDSKFEPKVCYVAPMTDQQISIFARNWYAEQGTPAGAGLLRNTFLQAVWANEGTSRLARTPNLLTMMALIFKVRSQLPNGRALLYEDIAQAYLESIDTARNLKDPIPWQKKKIWLARVGFEMQLRRPLFVKVEDVEDDQTLLISRKDLLCWIKSAMEDTGDLHDDEYAEKYLDWIARRSGLLIPRGEGQFAFMHLSFQEYFAAVYIQFQMQNPAWLDDEEDEDDLTVDTRVNKGVLAEWADSINWQQSLIFLFELFDSKQGWSNRLWRYCFIDELFAKQKQKWDRLQLNKPSDFIINATFRLSLFHLQIQLLSNPHVTTSEKIVKNSLNKLMELAMYQQNRFSLYELSSEQKVSFFPAIITLTNQKSLLSTLLLSETLRESVVGALNSMQNKGELTLKYEGIDPEIIRQIS